MDAKTKWAEAERISVGRYPPFRGLNPQDFFITLHASPLVALFEAASAGARVYEFMSISRPGDLLHYLWATPDQACIDVVRCIDQKFPGMDSKQPKPSEAGLPFTTFDSCFAFAGDDTDPVAMTWIDYRRSDALRNRLVQMLNGVQQLQQQLLGSDNFLLRHELDLMESKCHRRDFDAEVQRWAMRSNPYRNETALPCALFRLIRDLIARDDVTSVSCPFNDFALWRALVAEQIQRSIRMGRAPQEAFALSGPDSGLPMIPYLEWGGNVHIPYEGVAEADLLITPEWLKLDAGKGSGAEGRLSRVAGGKARRYLLTDRDLGTLDCATHERVEGWNLYRAKLS